MLASALEIALAHRRSIYDAIYVALALRENCEMVTADERLYNALQGTQIAGTVLTIQQFAQRG